MALLERNAWYDIARDTKWTPSYVTEDELFPPEMADPFGIPTKEWETYDEPYKVSYREYVEHPAREGRRRVLGARRRWRVQVSTRPPTPAGSRASKDALRRDRAVGVPGARSPRPAWRGSRRRPAMRNMATFGDAGRDAATARSSCTSRTSGRARTGSSTGRTRRMHTNNWVGARRAGTASTT